MSAAFHDGSLDCTCGHKLRHHSELPTLAKYGPCTFCDCPLSVPVNKENKQ